MERCYRTLHSFVTVVSQLLLLLHVPRIGGAALVWAQKTRRTYSSWALLKCANAAAAEADPARHCGGGAGFRALHRRRAGETFTAPSWACLG